MRRSILGAVAMLGLAGCDDTLYPGGGDTDVPAGYTADWAGVNALFDDHCLGCHASGTPPALPADLQADLTSGAGAIVVAGDPAASPLWRVLANELEGDDVGVMPFGAQLPAAQVAHVKAWIEAGAVVD